LTSNPLFHRLELLVGNEVLKQLEKTRVIVFGLGGVGSWCAEGLVRNGIGHVTLVDSDVICMTNVNRQLQATAHNIGKPKVTELAERLQTIHPTATIVPKQEVYEYTKSDSFELDSYDYAIDAIDSLSNKFDLITKALESDATLFSAMGASCKLDPTRIQVGPFWQIEGCPLASKVRKRLRRWGSTQNFTAVYSIEQLPSHPATIACGSGDCVCPASSDENVDWCDAKAAINGSSVHVTATFGFILSGLVVQDIARINSR